MHSDWSRIEVLRPKSEILSGEIPVLDILVPVSGRYRKIPRKEAFAPIEAPHL